MRFAGKALASACVGALLAPYLIWCWAQIAGRGLFADPAIHAGLRGHYLHATLTAVDFAATVVLVLPAAWVLLRLGKEKLALRVALAVVSLGVASAALVGLPILSAGFWPTLSNILFYAALPTATWLASHFTGSAPNNSFKPKPLRGSA